MISAQNIRRLALILPPTLGLFLLGGGSHCISPIVSPFFLAATRNSAPNVSPPLKLNFETVSFLYALKFQKVSVMHIILSSVFKAIFSEILGNFVREATTTSNSLIFRINLGIVRRVIFQVCVNCNYYWVFCHFHSVE